MIKREYRIWLVIFIIVNIWATKIIFSQKQLIGDLEGVKLESSSSLFIALFLVLLCYFLLLVIGFNYFRKIKIPRIIKTPKSLSYQAKFTVSSFILLLQLAFFIFNQTEGVNVAGSLNVKSNSTLAFIWVFLPIDYIFYLYFVTFRNEKLLKTNLVLFIISNLSRGWSGFILILLFLEWCNRYRNRTLNYFRIVLFSAGVILVYPYLLNLKWVIRASKSSEIELSSSKDLLEGMIESKSYNELLSDGVEQIIGRLQQTAILTEVINKKELFENGIANDKFVSYYGEGFIQIAYRRIIGRNNIPNIGSMAPNYLRTDNPYELEAYNISVGLMSWVIILPFQIPLFFLYIGFLCYLSVFFARQINFTSAIDDAIWMSWLFLLAVGWISQFITFIYSILVFLIIIKIALFVSRIKLYGK